MYVILPFEKEFYEDKHNFPVHFVGHPLLDAIANRKPMDPVKFAEENGLNDKPVVALLPGSRKQEITKMLSVMLLMAPKFPDHQFVIDEVFSEPGCTKRAVSYSSLKVPFQLILALFYHSNSY